jgi:hypothetical protein
MRKTTTSKRCIITITYASITHSIQTTAHLREEIIMALKKRIPATAPKAPTSSATNTATKERKPIAPPARKPIAPPVKKAPAKPVVKQEPPKEVKKVEPKAKVQPPVQREERKSPEAPKPVVTAGSESPKPEPRRTTSEEVERFPIERIRLMELEERMKLFRRLNKDPEKFIPIRSDVPKQLQMRKDEAVLRKIIADKPKAKGMEVYYCPYCVDWQPFYNFSWLGSTKCIGCTVSTRDFYTAIDNGIFGKA